MKGLVAVIILSISETLACTLLASGSWLWLAALIAGIVASVYLKAVN